MVRAGVDPQRGLREDVLRKYFLASPRAVAGETAGKTVNSVLGGWPCLWPSPRSHVSAARAHPCVFMCVRGVGCLCPHVHCGSMCLRGPERGAREKVYMSVCAREAQLRAVCLCSARYRSRAQACVGAPVARTPGQRASPGRLHMSKPETQCGLCTGWCNVPRAWWRVRGVLSCAGKAPGT